MVGVIPRYPKNARLQLQAIWKNKTKFEDLVVIHNQPFVLLPGFTLNERIVNAVGNVALGERSPYIQQLKRLKLPKSKKSLKEDGDVVYARGSFYRIGDGVSGVEPNFIVKNKCAALEFVFKDRTIYLTSPKYIITKNSLMFLCVFSPWEISLLEVKNGEVVSKPDFFNSIYKFSIPNEEERTCLSRKLGLLPVS